MTKDLVWWQTISTNHPSLTGEVSARLALSFPSNVRVYRSTRKEGKYCVVLAWSHRANRSMHNVQVTQSSVFDARVARLLVGRKSLQAGQRGRPVA